MADLIDRETLLSKIEPDEYYHSNEIKDMVKDCQTVDAVPVVRCRDCCYFNADGCRLCSLIDGLCGADSDDFCSYGERKMR